MDVLLRFPEALEMVLREAESAGPVSGREDVRLVESDGRVLAAPISADRDQPPFARSTRDGFAVAGGDAWVVRGMVRAGESWSGGALAQGECVEIMTGAPVPPGAHAVVMVEHVVQDGDTVRMAEGRTARPAENIVPQGSEAAAGEMLLNAGTRMGPAEVALAASLGYVEVNVFRRPRVAVVATGDELVDVSETPGPWQIRNSNSHGIASLCARAGGDPIPEPAVRDDLNELLRVLEDVLQRADLLILSGGVSAGKFDLVEEALKRLGAEFLFRGVKMQPGKPVVFGRVRGTYFFGLPGNPISTQVTFRTFAEPMVRSLGGERGAAPLLVQATLAREVAVKPGLWRFLPGTLRSRLGATKVELSGWQGSGDLAANARANCYVVVPDEVERIAAGSTVQVLLQS